MEKFSVDNIKTKLSKIKEVLMAEENEENKDLELEDVRMVDGTILRIEPAIEVGATVQVIGEDGEMVDAPDADHELEDGRVLRTEGGLIVEVLGEDVEEEVVEEEMSEEETAEPTLEERINARVKELVTKHNEDLEAKIAGLKFAKVEEIEALKEENATLKQSLIEVVDMFETFSASEATEPKKKQTNPFKKKDTKEFDFSQLRRN